MLKWFRFILTCYEGILIEKIKSIGDAGEIYTTNWLSFGSFLSVGMEDFYWSVSVCLVKPVHEILFYKMGMK